MSTETFYISTTSGEIHFQEPNYRLESVPARIEGMRATIRVPIEEPDQMASGFDSIIKKILAGIEAGGSSRPPTESSKMAELPLPPPGGESTVPQWTNPHAGVSQPPGPHRAGLKIRRSEDGDIDITAL